MVILWYTGTVSQMNGDDLFSQNPVVAGGLECENPVWFFGEVDSVKYPRLSHEFFIRNVSDSTVNIGKTVSTCGCVVTEGYEKSLLPGRVPEYRSAFSCYQHQAYLTKS